MEDRNVISPVEAVIFDFAGTLVAGDPNWEYPQTVACAEAGRVVTPDEVKAAIWKVWGPREGCTHRAASANEERYARWIGAIEREILANLGLPEAAMERAAARVMELQVDPACYRLYPDTRPALAALKARGVRLALVSNFAWRLPELVDGLGLAGYFDLVVTSARAGYRKPRPEIFSRALAELGTRPERTLFVGDDPECDYQGARRTGLRALLIDRPGRGGDDLERITDLSAVLGYLASPADRPILTRKERGTTETSPSDCL